MLGKRSGLGFASFVCIKDSSIGATRFEALWSDKRRVLVDVADSGSIGFASLPFFFFVHCKISGLAISADPLHRLHDDHNNATTASGLAPMKTERIIVSSHKNGTLKAVWQIFVDYRMHPWSTFLQPMPMTSFICLCILTSSLTSGVAKFPVMWGTPRALRFCMANATKT